MTDKETLGKIVRETNDKLRSTAKKIAEERYRHDVAIDKLVNQLYECMGALDFIKGELSD